MPAPAPKSKFRLSRSEWLVLLGVLLFLLSSLGPGWWAWHRHQRLGMVHVDLRVLDEAAQRFNREYGVWPGGGENAAKDRRFGRELSNAQVLNVLRAVEGPGNPQHRGNDQQIVFIEVELHRPGWSGLDESGAFLDPWGTPYQMVFDSNFDNVCEVENSIYGRLIGQGLALWSCGPDRRSDTADDILAW